MPRSVRSNGPELGQLDTFIFSTRRVIGHRDEFFRFQVLDELMDCLTGDVDVARHFGDGRFRLINPGEHVPFGVGDIDIVLLVPSPLADAANLVMSLTEEIEESCRRFCWSQIGHSYSFLSFLTIQKRMCRVNARDEFSIIQ